MNTSKDIKDEMGVGFIQTEDAWAYLLRFADCKDLDVAYNIAFKQRDSARGLYLREHPETHRRVVVAATVTPAFPLDPTYGADAREAEQHRLRQYAHTATLSLVCTKPWVSAPEFVFMNSGERTFNVAVNASVLEEGKLHVAEVQVRRCAERLASCPPWPGAQGFDTTCPEKGPLLRIPVTVVKPRLLDSTATLQLSDLAFSPAKIRRVFVAIPRGATLAGACHAMCLLRAVLTEDPFAPSDALAHARYGCATGRVLRVSSAS
ncbi:MAG TPA: hypothetical protein VMF89_05010, partial [Polyangiales bacterium]|nr:hypothetical protein [Polyangiales bacterium]